MALAGLLVAACSGVAPSAAGSSAARPPTAPPPSRPASPPSARASPSASLSPSAPPSPSPSPSASSQAAATPGYQEYANPRYGFSTLWPASFTAQPPPTDGDGQAWTWASPQGQVSLAAYGSNNVLSYSPQQDEAADCRGMSVAYRHISGNIVTVSGYRKNGRVIVYERDVVGPGAIDTLYWRYPASEKAQWDAAVTATALAFRPGDVLAPH